MEEPYNNIDMGMHAHFDFDFTLHKDKANRNSPLTETPVLADAENIWGVADWTEEPYKDSYRSPYAIVHDPLRYRLCRSYRYGERYNVILSAPYDQRIDGFYAERFAKLLYYSRDGNFNAEKGVITYWLKPGFIPELMGYNRVFCDISRTQDTENLYGNFTFTHKFGWSRKMEEDTLPPFESRILPYGMLFRIARKVGDWYEPWNKYCASYLSTLNHRYHGYTDPRWQWPGGKHTDRGGDLFHAHRWIHITLSWVNTHKPGGHYGGKIGTRIIVNGFHLDPFAFKVYTTNWYAPPYPKTVTRVPGIPAHLPSGKLNPLVLGGSRWTMESANSTIDEFHLTRIYEEGEIDIICQECEGTGKVRCTYCTRKCSYGCAPLGACGKLGMCPKATCGSCKPLCPDCKVFKSCGTKDYRCGEEKACISCECGWIPCKFFPGVCSTWKNYKCIEVEDVWYDCNKCKYKDNPLCSCSTMMQCKTKGFMCERETCGRCLAQICGESKFCVKYEDPFKGFRLCENIGYKCLPCGECSVSCILYGCLKLGDCKDKEFRCARCRPCGGTGKLTMVGELTPHYELRLQWLLGRYYRQNDAVFTSQQIDLGRRVNMLLAEPNCVSDPYGQPRWTKRESSIEKQTTVWLKRRWQYPAVKILGITWTAYTREIMDHKFPWKEPLKCQIEFSLEGKNRYGRWLHIAGPFLNRDAGWAGVMVNIPSGIIRYRVRFNTRCDPANAILLETPVLDDLTIYYTTHPQFVSWVEGQ
jgi:hypothetical protein